MALDKQQITQEISKYLKAKSYIDYAIIFGSFVERDNFRDIDIAISTNHDIPLIEIGGLISELEMKTRFKIDIEELSRELIFSNPELTFDIFNKGELLFENAKESYITNKSLANSVYFDTEPLRREMVEAFQNRVNSDRIGDRGYA